MVSAEYFDPVSQDLPNQPVGRLILQPNNSMNWHAARLFLSTLLFVSLATASSFAYAGYWFILPFTVVEMLLLVACFYYSIRRNQTVEVITFGSTKISIEAGRTGPEQRCDWQRFFTKVFVEPPKQKGYSSTVLLKCRAETREVGSFLNVSDKEELIHQIYLMIDMADARQSQQR